MRHALALGVVGIVISLVGVVVTITHNLGPVWYPIVLVLVALPAAWAGGALYGLSMGRGKGTHRHTQT